MTDLIRPDLMQRLIAIAGQEQRSVDAVLERLLAAYPAESLDTAPLAADEAENPATSEPWGQLVVRLLESLGPIEMTFPEIDDPVEWVRAIRQRETERLRSYWEDET